MTNKDLKEFREQHKDKTYDEYINMYNDKKKETFESIYEDKVMIELNNTLSKMGYTEDTSLNSIPITIEQLYQLIKLNYISNQLHSTEIEEKQLEINQLKASCQYKELKERDKEITELKREKEDLGNDCYFKYEKMVQEKDKEIEDIKMFRQIMSDKLQNQIKELQAEIQDLKIRYHCK
jgi:hypothetical protein